jgi:uncharacterized protein YecT (DUF1311 family)
MKKKFLTTIMAMCLGTSLLAACGNTAPEAAQEGAEVQESDGQEGDGQKDDGQGASGSGEESGEVATSGIEGHWQLMCELSHIEYSDGDFYDTSLMYCDGEAPASEMIIRSEGDQYVVDYYYTEYDYYEKNCGIPMVKSGDDSSFTFTLADPFDDSSDDQELKLYLNDEGRLVVEKQYRYEDESDPEYWSNSTYTSIYLPKGSPLFDDPESLRYFDTVTVSNTADLLNSIQNNRKILLEAGEYDFSQVASKAINNFRISESWDGTKNVVSEVSSLCIEAKDGAKVELCIDEPYDPVISFNNSKGITLRNLTVGHHVEPGYCSGSVLYFEGVDHLNVDKCNLYGSGTYGIEAYNTYDANVTDTDIYECTYGLVALHNVGTFNFKNCVMRDSSDLSMIDCDSAYDVTFEDCVFSGNDATSFDTTSFVEVGEYDRVTFRNCEFNDNKFYTFSNREVTLENCTETGNSSAMTEYMNASEASAPTKDSLLEGYNAAVDRQAEIDNELSTNALLDQATLNQLAYEEFNLWDSLINQMWTYLSGTLDEENMTNLKAEQQKWIKDKEAAMKTAGADFEGGTMQPMIEYSTGAKLTRERLEVLIQRYIGD